MNRNAYFLRELYLENGRRSVGTGFNVCARRRCSRPSPDARPGDANGTRCSPGPRAGHERIPRPEPPCRCPWNAWAAALPVRCGDRALNASYLKKRVLDLAAAQPDLKWVVIDGSTVNTVDSTGAETLGALARDLGRQGIRLALAGFRTETRAMLDRAGALPAIDAGNVFPTLKSAMNAFLAIVQSRRPMSPAVRFLHKPSKTNPRKD